MFQTKKEQKKIEILFIGNFLSRSTGSYSVSEFIAGKIGSEEGIKVRMASAAENRLVRLAEIFCSSLFKNYAVLHIDVFSGNSFLFARIAAAIGKARREKVVLTLHGGALHEHYQGRESAFRKLFANAIVQSPSLFLKTFFEQKDFVVHYCPNPVLLSNFPYNREKVEPCRLLWVRAFAEIYNPHVPILVLQKIIQDFPNTTLTMIGPDKGLMEATKQLTEKLNLKDRVIILGPVKNDKLYTYYQTHSVYLNTTSYESFGVALVEAASCGVPVVSFSVGEIPYLWKNEENILLCDLGDVEKMTMQVKRILQDENLSAHLSKNARKRAEDFSWNNIKGHWIKLIKN